MKKENNEIKLHGNVKIDSYLKLSKYIKYKHIDCIRVSRKQYMQYFKVLRKGNKSENPFKYLLYFNGIPLLLLQS